eukprot:8297833-Pyramimonas_sp.AAC.1
MIQKLGASRRVKVGATNCGEKKVPQWVAVGQGARSLSAMYNTAGLGGDAGDGGDAVQHGHLRDDGVCERGDQVGRRAEERAGAVHAAPVPLRPARGGGVLGHPRSHPVPRAGALAGGKEARVPNPKP